MTMVAKIPYKDIGGTILTFGLAAASMYYLLNFAIKKTLSDPDSASTSSKNYDNNIKRFSSSRPDLSRSLNRREKIIMASVICPQDLDVRFEDVGGLDNITEELREGVLYPLTHPQVFVKQSSLLQAPKGVLLYGPPGCGKTMLAKALAAESSANFINIRMSTILDQWYGEANKLVTAVFSLAKKLEPSIIFIDEIDSFLRERRKTDHEATAMLKAEFMTLWDGLTSERGILVVGATNRPNDIDPAILRRMPKRFAIPLPDSTQRKKILQTILTDTRLDENFDFDEIINKTAGMSGSDLKELCRDAAMVVAREYIRQSRSGTIDQDEDSDMRPLRNEDFFVSGASQALNPLNYISEDSLIPLDG